MVNRAKIKCILIAGILLGFCALANADIPKYINYQGRLTDNTGNPVADGTYGVTFRLYTDETGGSALWTENQSLTVTDGVFNVALGTESELDLTFNVPYWLSVQVGSDTEMSPRQRIAAAGYALNADKLDTLTSSQLLRSDINDVAAGQLTLTYEGTALVVQPARELNADTKLIDVKNATGTSKFSIDSEGDFAAQNSNLSGTLEVDGITTLSNTLAVTGAANFSSDVQLSGRIRQGSLGDLAEMMPLPKNKAFALPQAADVVMIAEDGSIRRCHQAFATNVAGIISTNPAQILRDNLENAVPVALNGVVPCKVTAENGPIQPGDLLVSSSLPAHAMRAGQNPPAGSVIGKALDKLDRGEGIIEVLVMLK